MNEQNANAPSAMKIAIGSAVALIVAGAILVFAVLPAEFGIDVLGSGKKSGLSELSKAGEMTELERGALREGVLTLSDEPLRSDRWEWELAPFESIEYKYTLAEGQPMVFSWKGTEALNYDMHAHPFDGGVDLTESYGVDQAQAMQGLYVAPFTGIHGWFFENRTMEPVTLTLNATGMFTSSTIFEGTVEKEQAIAPLD